MKAYSCKGCKIQVTDAVCRACGAGLCNGGASGKSGPKDQVALHYYYRIGARLTRYRNCKFHNGCLTISRHADGISRYSVPPSAGPLLPLGGASVLPSACPTGHRSAAARQPAGLLLSTGVCSKYQSTAAGVALQALALSSKCERHHGGGGSTQTCL